MRPWSPSTGNSWSSRSRSFDRRPSPRMPDGRRMRVRRSRSRAERWNGAWVSLRRLGGSTAAGGVEPGDRRSWIGCLDDRTPSRHADPRRRDRTRSVVRRSDGARCGGSRDRVGRADGGFGGPRRARRPPAGGDPRGDPHYPGRDQGADHDAGGLGVPQHQRGTPTGSGPLRGRPPRPVVAGRPHASRAGGSRRGPGEHRGPLPGGRVRGRLSPGRRAPDRAPESRRRRDQARRGRHGEADLRRRDATDRAVRLRVREGEPPRPDHPGTQGRHHADLRRTVPHHRPGRGERPRRRLVRGHADRSSDRSPRP